MARDVQMFCQCGCRQPVNPGCRYATRACWHRVLTPERRSMWSSEGSGAYGRRVETACACGCGETFMRKVHGSRAGQRFVSSLHAARHRRGPEFRQWHRQRLDKAIASRRSNAFQRALERAKGMSPADAYAKGYHVGYNAAYHRWKLWAEGKRRKSA